MNEIMEWLARGIIIDKLPWCGHASVVVVFTPKEWSNERRMLLLLLLLLLLELKLQ